MQTAIDGGEAVRRSSLTEDLAARSLTVPIGPWWSPHDCDQGAHAVLKVAHHLLQ